MHVQTNIKKSFLNRLFYRSARAIKSMPIVASRAIGRLCRGGTVAAALWVGAAPVVLAIQSATPAHAQSTSPPIENLPADELVARFNTDAEVQAGNARVVSVCDEAAGFIRVSILLNQNDALRASILSSTPCDATGSGGDTGNNDDDGDDDTGDDDNTPPVDPPTTVTDFDASGQSIAQLQAAVAPGEVTSVECLLNPFNPNAEFNLTVLFFIEALNQLVSRGFTDIGCTAPGGDGDTGNDDEDAGDDTGEDAAPQAGTSGADAQAQAGNTFTATNPSTFTGDVFGEFNILDNPLGGIDPFDPVGQPQVGNDPQDDQPARQPAGVPASPPIGSGNPPPQQDNPPQVIPQQPVQAGNNEEECDKCRQELAVLEQQLKEAEDNLAEIVRQEILKRLAEDKKEEENRNRPSPAEDNEPEEEANNKLIDPNENKDVRALEEGARQAGLREGDILEAFENAEDNARRDQRDFDERAEADREKQRAAAEAELKKLQADLAKIDAERAQAQAAVDKIIGDIKETTSQDPEVDAAAKKGIQEIERGADREGVQGTTVAGATGVSAGLGVAAGGTVILFDVLTALETGATLAQATGSAIALAGGAGGALAFVATAGAIFGALVFTVVIATDLVIGGGTFFENESQARARLFREVSDQLKGLAEARSAVAAIDKKREPVAAALREVIARIEALNDPGTKPVFDLQKETERRLREQLEQRKESFEANRQGREATERVDALLKQIADKRGEIARLCAGQASLPYDGGAAATTRIAGGNQVNQSSGHVRTASTTNRSMGNRPTGANVAVTSYGLTGGFDLRRWRREHGLALAGNGEDGLLADPRFNLFFSTAINFGDNRDQDSDSYSISGGFSYLITPQVNLGVAARYADTDINSATASFDAETWGISLFAQSQWAVGTGKINIDGIVAYSQTDLEAVFNNAGVITTANPETSAFSGQFKASTAFDLGGYNVSPFVSLSYAETRQEAFLLSDAQLAPGAFNDDIIFSAGSSIAKTIFWEEKGLTFSPNAGVGLFGNDSVGFSVNAGLGIKSQSGVKVGLGAAYADGGNGIDNFTFTGKLTIPLN